MNIKKFIMCIITYIAMSDSAATTTRYSLVAYNIQYICEQLNALYRDIGRFPTNDEGLSILLDNPEKLSGWKGAYIQRHIIFDSWSNQISYYYPAKYGDQEYDLYSYGVNRMDNLSYGDDISNWRILKNGECQLNHNPYSNSHFGF